jgi:hypothetical protein
MSPTLRLLIEYGQSAWDEKMKKHDARVCFGEVNNEGRTKGSKSCQSPFSTVFRCDYTISGANGPFSNRTESGWSKQESAIRNI